MQCDEELRATRANSRGDEIGFDPRMRCQKILRSEMMLSVSRALFVLFCADAAMSSCRPIFHREPLGLVLLVEGAASGSANDKTARLTSGARIGPGEKITSLSLKRAESEREDAGGPQTGLIFRL